MGALERLHGAVPSNSLFRMNAVALSLFFLLGRTHAGPNRTLSDTVPWTIRTSVSPAGSDIKHIIASSTEPKNKSVGHCRRRLAGWERRTGAFEDLVVLFRCRWRPGRFPEVGGV
jgi:hypothetical protein